MNDESLEDIERQISGASPIGAPQELRAAVLTDVHRELRAAKWDRWLARAAVVLLVVGVGLNFAVGISTETSHGARQPLARADSRQSLVETAVVVAAATDAATGCRFARQMAAMSGRVLTADERAVIDAAVRLSTANGNRG